MTNKKGDPMAKIEVGDRIRVLVGVYTGKEGRVDSLSDAPKCIGVYVFGSKEMTLPLTWFKADEIEVIPK